MPSTFALVATTIAIAALFILLLFGIGTLVKRALDPQRARRRRHAQAVSATWSSEYHGMMFVYRGELIGTTWAVHGDNGNGAIRGTLEECQAWVAEDILNRVERHDLDYH